MASASQPPCIYVLAGANGAGKSSIGGAALLQHGVEYFNPDEAARRILAANPTIGCCGGSVRAAGLELPSKSTAYEMAHPLLRPGGFP